LKKNREEEKSGKKGGDHKYQTKVTLESDSKAVKK